MRKLAVLFVVMSALFYFGPSASAEETNKNIGCQNLLDLGFGSWELWNNPDEQGEKITLHVKGDMPDVWCKYAPLFHVIKADFSEDPSKDDVGSVGIVYIIKTTRKSMYVEYCFSVDKRYASGLPSDITLSRVSLMASAIVYDNEDVLALYDPQMLYEDPGVSCSSK